jgi:excisionase family DNA binding protein
MNAFDDRLLRLDEAAALLGLRVATLRAWRLTGRIPVVRVGTRAIRVPLSAVRRIAEQGLIPGRKMK